MNEDCIFCKIIKGDIPSEKVYEDEKVLAFKDIHPKAPIHILLIPKKHIGSVATLDEKETEILPHLFLSAKKIAVQQGINRTGFRTVFNAGSDAGMEVRHLHLHILGGGPLRGMG